MKPLPPAEEEVVRFIVQLWKCMNVNGGVVRGRSCGFERDGPDKKTFILFIGLDN